MTAKPESRKIRWMPPAYYMPGQAYQVRHDKVMALPCRVNKMGIFLFLDVTFHTKSGWY